MPLESTRGTWSARELAAALAALLAFVAIAWLINPDRPAGLGARSRNGSLLRLGTGDVQVTLQWQADVDLDLHVVDPRGEEIWYKHRSAQSGGQLDVDANAGCESGAMMTNPVENVFWRFGGAPNGHYVVRVNYYQDCSNQGSVPYTVRVKVGDHITSFNGTLGNADETQKVAEFDR